MKNLKRFLAGALLTMVSTIMCAQKVEVSGTVVDQSGEAIIGASVMEKGTSNGTVTDFDGNFKFMRKSPPRLSPLLFPMLLTSVCPTASLTASAPFSSRTFRMPTSMWSA